MKPTLTSPLPGCIESGVLYRVSEVRQRLSIGEHAWKRIARGLRALGLPPTKIGMHDAIMGDDLIAYLARQREQASNHTP
jgi:hypothetical protein